LRVGILGGAFNPPHIGHLVCAQEALVQLELERVLFMPVGVAPHREIERGARLLREPEVTDVRRVEGPAEDADRAAHSLI
jgi:nicotinate-nucleotide adenylyltransferase